MPPSTATRTGLARRGVRLLVHRGLIDPRDIHRYGLTVRDVSQSNGVALVELGSGHGFAIKDVTQGHSAQGDPAREIALYRNAASMPEAAGVVPRFFLHDESENLLVTEGLLSARRIDGQRSRGALDPLSAQSFGTALGTWHRASRGMTGLAASRPWLLSLDGDDRLEVIDRSDVLRLLADRVLADDGHRAVIEELRAAWTPDATIHGDVRFSNVLVRADGTSALIDWEYAGLGDVDWDVAGAVQEFMSAGASFAGVGFTAPITAFLSAYAIARGTEPDRRRLAVFVSGRLLVRAFQIASWTSEPGEEIDRHLGLARDASRLAAA